MSSREIAELTGKEHRSVLRDIDVLNEHYEKLGMHKTVQGYYTLPATGKQRHRCFELTKIQTMDLMTGYNIPLRIKVNRRWEQLEHQQSNTGNLISMTEELQRQRQELHDDMKQLEARAEKLEIIEEFILESMAKSGYRLDSAKANDTPIIQEPKLTWQNSFILTYEQYVYDNITTNIDEWLSQGTIPVADFNSKYKPKGLGVKMYIRAIKWYCIHCNIRFVPHKVVYLTQAGSIRCRIFESQ